MALNRDHDLIPSSPSNSSLSSSDLDTESTGSFFPDRSTSLGTLMGVSFPDLPRRAPRAATITAPTPEGGGRGRGRRSGGGAAAAAGEGVVAPLPRRRGGAGLAGEFLQVERRIGGGAVDGDYVYVGGGGGGGGAAEHEAVGGGPLFEDGRVLPPEGRRRGQQRAAEGPVGRWPVLLTGICTGGEA
uniref:Uncharacterized protein n=1 Tax=Ananas comosus var. bracteatus TaxID=296719 RepID=A0A6V7P6U6_ANACO|nr:unnamed protein product [Ananas comosus var. bracteatus]